MTNPAILEPAPQLNVSVIADVPGKRIIIRGMSESNLKSKKQISHESLTFELFFWVENGEQITDSGLGMTEEQLAENLGTIARSGTSEFLAKLDKGDGANLIGQSVYCPPNDAILIPVRID